MQDQQVSVYINHIKINLVNDSQGGIYEYLQGRPGRPLIFSILAWDH